MLTDHIAILVHSALAEPKVNMLKADKPLEYFAQLAFDPQTATQDLLALCAEKAPGGKIQGLMLPVRVNSAIDKPIPGIPGDWLVVRAATLFAPYVADQDGNHLVQEEAAGAIRAAFYPGKKVRAALSAFAWEFKGKQGVSFNLQGIMAVSDGERLNVGEGVVANAFAAYAKPGTSTASTASTASPTSTASTNDAGANPFGAQKAGVQDAPAPSNSNPFQQSPAAANPFAQG